MEPSDTLGNQSELVRIKRDVGKMEKALPNEVNHDLLEIPEEPTAVCNKSTHREKQNT